ncbi:MAG TPA: HAMP domain-containing sensor histidine kinase [Anaerolineaceae bacterium]
MLLFGVTVYGLVSTMLVGQIDNALDLTYNAMITGAEVNSRGSLDILTLPSLDLTDNIFYQVWSRSGTLSASNLSTVAVPLDPVGVQAARPLYRSSYVNQAHIRVLSVPLQVNGREIAVLQIGSSLALIDTTQQTMLIVLAATALVSMVLAGLGAWLTTGRTLAPLETVTQVATHITRADDLSRRIPFSGKPSDEVGQLIVAFNETMSRLETLFTAQRRFLADVSHELRTPLTVIKGNVGLLRRIGTTDEESLESIEAEVDRLTRLVGDLLLLAQAESGKMPLDMRPVELDTVLLEVFQQMRILAGDRLQIKLTDIDQVQVVGDRDRIKQVLLNLVGNAIKYTPAGGQVLLSLAKSNEQARLLIKDTGPGIPAPDLPHIFERFYRAEKSRTRTREGSGFGLGLSIAYWIVRNHNGRIEVDSKEGSGTTFCVWLPLVVESTVP